MGSKNSVTGPHGHTFSFPEIMGSQDSVTGPYCLWRHTLFPCDHGQSRLRHWATWPHILIPQDNGQSRFRHWSVLFIATYSSLAIMGSHESVTGPYGHTFSFLEINSSQDSFTGPYYLWRHTLFPCDHG
ncbi:hypothetical protein BgiMline_024349 [Biomphalaria glabrata]|nr:hypothetical protein BgiMline_007553 [Biomphalaria glabrata]